MLLPSSFGVQNLEVEALNFVCFFLFKWRTFAVMCSLADGKVSAASTRRATNEIFAGREIRRHLGNLP